MNKTQLSPRKTTFRSILTGILVLCLLPVTAALANSLQDVSFSTLPGDRVQIKLSLQEPASEPTSFTIDNPARIAFDFADTTINLPRKSQDIGIGVARSINAIEAGGRTRVVINLAKLVGYSTTVSGNDVIITLNDDTADKFAAAEKPPTETVADTAAAVNILNLDFRRGTKGEGRVELTLADPNTAVDMTKRGKQVIVTLKNSALSEDMERRLDVIDFATPVQTVDAFNHGNDVRLIISAITDFDHIAYQADEKLTIDLKPIVKKVETDKQRAKFGYTGERLSLNFQNIEVRAVLQLIADFTGINMVTSDTVSGNLTLRLKNVPWDQALDIVLKTKGLAKRVSGNVMLIAPTEEIAAREKLELEASKQIVELAPLINETIQVNYAKASEIAALVQSKEKSFMSARGNITIDQRTNKLLVQDTADNVDLIIALVEELDIPIRQVLIESRIVLATNQFTRELGVKFGLSSETTSGSRSVTTSGSLNAADSFNQFGVAPQLDERLNVNLPAVSSSAGSIGLAIAKLPFGTLLDLELSAAQAEGKSETVSSPKVITADQQEAVIESGQEIPYQEASSSGATSVSFKKAVLSLKVTPQITPDDRIVMDLAVNKDSPDFGNLVQGVPPINTNNVETQVLVDNGETVVLGGVYEQTKTKNINRVPFFGDLPLVGVLFRNKTETNDKQELLIFVTPKLLKEDIRL
ncbi:MAG: type IV pilus secretin PilQ [Gammaproteobacteria bacterium]|nr:type IV pilus secretin PilQ [Gammaproteobacteria bacterium]